jgi:DNA-binding CsgD family transcriptional regulator
MYDAQLDSRGNFGGAAASIAGFGDLAAWPAVRREPAALQAAVLMCMLDEIDYGLMVLGADAQILLENQAARLELGGEQFVRRRQDRLAPSSMRHGAKIEAALEDVRRGRRSLVTLSDSDGELALSFVPLHSSAQPTAQIEGAPLALLILGKRDAVEVPKLQQYGHLHGLTGAERALLPAIIRGSSVKIIAEQQRVAVNTVRTQLASIRDKTGAKSLRTLAARLTSLPPIRLSPG